MGFFTSSLPPLMSPPSSGEQRGNKPSANRLCRYHNWRLGAACSSQHQCRALYDQVSHIFRSTVANCCWHVLSFSEFLADMKSSKKGHVVRISTKTYKFLQQSTFPAFFWKVTWCPTCRWTSLASWRETQSRALPFILGPKTFGQVPPFLGKQQQYFSLSVKKSSPSHVMLRLAMMRKDNDDQAWVRVWGKNWPGPGWRWPMCCLGW